MKKNFDNNVIRVSFDDILLNPATKELFDSPQNFNSPWWNIDSKSLSIQ